MYRSSAKILINEFYFSFAQNTSVFTLFLSNSLNCLLFIMSYELLPGHTAVSYELHLSVIRPKFVPCEPNHPQAFDLNTKCLIRYNEEEGLYTTDVYGLPLRFEASYHFLDGRTSKTWINKSLDTYGKVSFTMDPICSVDAKDIFRSIRGRHHKASAAGRRMTSLRREASKHRLPGLSTAADSNVVASVSVVHVCSDSCRPVSYTPPEPVTNLDLPIGTPTDSGSNGQRIGPPLRQIQPIAYVDSSSDTTNNSRKRHMDSDRNKRPLKAARN